MQNIEPRWALELRGDAEDLEYLAGRASFPDLSVTFVSREVGYLLHCREFGDCVSAAEVLARGRPQLSALSGALRLDRRSSTLLYPGAVYEQLMNGQRRAYLLVEESLDLVRYGVHSACITGADGSVIEPQRPNSALDLAGIDPAVSKALRLSVTPDSKTWTGLYRWYEVIVHDVLREGSSVQSKGWASKNEMTLFERTASSSASGDASRHGHERYDAPVSPMTLEFAIQLLDRLMRAWLAEKVKLAIRIDEGNHND